MSTASPAKRSPAPSMLAAPSLTPDTTGIPGRRPRAVAAAAVSEPSREPNGRAAGTCDARTPAPASSAADGTVS